jgi:mycothiol synthase
LSLSVTIRSLRADDTADIVALYDRAGSVDPGLGPISEGDWRRFVAAPQNLAGRDFRIAECNGKCLGIAESSLKDQDECKVRFFKIVVDPSARRDGVASALLAELLAIDADDILSLQSLCSSRWLGGVAFLEALGFEQIEAEIAMRCVSLTPPLARARREAAINRADDPRQYVAAVARIHNAAFRDDIAFRPFSEEEMRQALEVGELWIATREGHIVGFCRLEPEPTYVWLESIAIEPVEQGRGLGRALAYHALEAHRVSSEHHAALNVSSANAAAIKIYHQLGFESRSELRRYSAPRDRVVLRLGAET